MPGQGSCLHFSPVQYQIIREHNVLPTFNVHSTPSFFLKCVCSVHAVGLKGSQSLINISGERNKKYSSPKVKFVIQRGSCQTWVLNKPQHDTWYLLFSRLPRYWLGSVQVGYILQMLILDVCFYFSHLYWFCATLLALLKATFSRIHYHKMFVLMFHISVVFCTETWFLFPSSCHIFFLPYCRHTWKNIQWVTMQTFAV